MHSGTASLATPPLRTSLPCSRLHRGPLLSLFACSMALACLVPPARAYWGPNGNQVTSGYSTPLQIYVAASDGQGGAFVVWSQLASGPGLIDSIRCVRVASDGNLAPGWPAEGKCVCAAPSYSTVDAAPDDAGGIYITFVRGFSSGTHELYVTRMTSEGSVAPGWPADGLLLSDTPNAKIAIVRADGLGGAGVSWQSRYDNNPFAPTHQDLYAARVMPGGTLAPGWPAGGVAVKVAPPSLQVNNATHYHRMAADGAGGFYLAWIDSFSTTDDVYVQHLAANGTITPGWPAGGRTACAVLSEKGSVGSGPYLAFDGVGGVFVGWIESRSGRFDGYVMRIAADGLDGDGWPADGMVPCGGPYAGLLFGLDADGAGGAVLGYELLEFTYDLFGSIGVCRINAYGTPDPGWPTGGVVLTDTLSLHHGVYIGADGGGGARVLWLPNYNDTSRPLANRVDGTGVIAAGWPALGKPVTVAISAKSNLQVVPDRHAGEIVCWLQGTGPYEIWAQRLGADGRATTDAPPARIAASRLAAAPNPFHSRVDLSLTLPSAGEVHVIVCDVAGRAVRTLARGAMTAGPQRLSWDGRSDAGVAQPPGIYVVSARGPGFECSRRIVRVR